MDRICDYCKCQFDDSLDKCPHCGAPNSYVRRGEGVPRTIEELRQWYISRNLPSENITRFFIGKNITEPKAFGIYRESGLGDFIVYKNKANGERVIRYKGGDESYAVNELYLRLKEEISNQKALNSRYRKETGISDENTTYKQKNDYKQSNRQRTDASLKAVLILIAICILIGGIIKLHSQFNQNKAVLEEYRMDNGEIDWNSYNKEHPYVTHDKEYDSGWDSNWDSNDSWDSGGTDWNSDW